MNVILVYASAARASILQQLAYVGELLLHNISLVIFMSIFVALWSTAYAVGGRPGLVGYRLEEMIWYLAMTESILLARSRLWLRISQEVKSGDIAYRLSRPYMYPLFEIATSLGDSIVRLGLNALIAGVVALLFTRGIAGLPAGWVLFGMMAVIGLTIDALIAVMIGLLAFFVEEVQPIFWVYDKVLFTLGGLFMPLEVFPDTVRTIAEWLPLKVILYLPARVFVKFDPAFALESFLQQIIVLGALGLVLSMMWPICVQKVTIQGG